MNIKYISFLSLALVTNVLTPCKADDTYYPNGAQDAINEQRYLTKKEKNEITEYYEKKYFNDDSMEQSALENFQKNYENSWLKCLDESYKSSIQLRSLHQISLDRPIVYPYNNCYHFYANFIIAEKKANQQKDKKDAAQKEKYQNAAKLQKAKDIAKSAIDNTLKANTIIDIL